MTAHREKTFGPRACESYAPGAAITATVRYDDRCGNGHDTFSITGDITAGRREIASGCLHEEIAAAFPELAPFIKWHLVSDDEPMHYVANTVYHASDHWWLGSRPQPKERNLDAARSCAVWPDATDEELTAPDLRERLLARLPALMTEFRAAMASLFG